MNAQKREGTGESPRLTILQATSSVARDDRDGCSRYRAAKMSHNGIIRVVPRFFTPLSIAIGAFYFCNLFWR